MNQKETKTLKKIKGFAHGSFYRMNAKTADCYVFNFTENGSDWEGGWDWSKMLVDKDAEYILMLNTNEVLNVGKL